MKHFTFGQFFPPPSANPTRSQTSVTTESVVVVLGSLALLDQFGSVVTIPRSPGAPVLEPNDIGDMATVLDAEEPTDLRVLVFVEVWGEAVMNHPEPRGA